MKHKGKRCTVYDSFCLLSYLKEETCHTNEAVDCTLHHVGAQFLASNVEMQRRGLQAAMLALPFL